LNILGRFSKNALTSEFMKFCSMGAELLPLYGRMDRKTCRSYL